MEARTGRGWTAAVAVALTLVVLAGGTSSAHPLPPAVAFHAPADAISLAAVEASPRAAIPYTAEAPPPTGPGTPYLGSVEIFLTFQYNNQSTLTADLAAVSDPSSADYRHYMTQAEFIAAFSPAADLYASAAAYFQRLSGVEVTAYTDRVSLDLVGPASSLGPAFGVEFLQYSSATAGRYYAEVGSPTLPGLLAESVAGVVGLSNYQRASLNLVGGASAPAGSAAPSMTDGYPSPGCPDGQGSQCVFGPDLQVSYDEASLLTITPASSSVIATILWAGCTLDTSTCPSDDLTGGFDPADTTAYFQDYLPAGEPRPTVVGVPLQGTPAPGANASYDATDAVTENTLDIEMAGSLAPGATIYNVYGSSSSSTSTDNSFAFILNPSSSYPGLAHVNVISNSWGSVDGTDAGWSSSLEEANMRGITVLAATGDAGDNPASAKYTCYGGVCTDVEFPSTDATNGFGDIAVGGTTISVNMDPSSPNYLHLTNEVAWYQNSSDPQVLGGSSGGVSDVYTEPDWQTDSLANAVISQVGPGDRGVPDIAAIAEWMNILLTVDGSQSVTIIGGTSVATPVEAGILAESDAVLAHFHQGSIGFGDPTIYAWADEQYTPLPTGGSPAYAPSGSYSSPLPMLAFHDITAGSNYLYSARPGYDLVTGWGSLDAYNFTAYVLGLNYSGAAFALDGLHSQLSLTGLSVFSTSPGGTPNPVNASVQQDFYLANSLGAPIYWARNVLLVSGDGSSGWTLTETGRLVYPNPQLYAQESVNVSAAAASTTSALPLSLALTSWLTGSGLSARLNFMFGSETFSILAPGAAFIVGAYDYDYYWQGQEITNSPVSPTAGVLDPQFGLLGGPNGSIGHFGDATQGSANLTVRPMGRTPYTSPLLQQLTPGSLVQPPESAVGLAWEEISSGWSVAGMSSGRNQTVQLASERGPVNPADFLETVYAVNISETGLAAGTTWSATIDGVTEHSATAWIVFELTNGTHNYTIASVGTQQPTPSSGSLSVPGTPTFLTVAFSAAACSGVQCLNGIVTPQILTSVIGIAILMAIVVAGALVLRRRRLLASAPYSPPAAAQGPAAPPGPPGTPPSTPGAPPSWPPPPPPPPPPGVGPT